MPTVAAWLVHVLTASGAAIALFAAIAAVLHAWQTTFLLLGLALLVDGVDGPLARMVHATEALPSIDGAVLDLVVDYGTYVLVPAIVLVEGPLLDPPYSAIAGVVVAIVGALYFADTRMKTASLAFRGFPAIWNGVVFLLMVFKPPQPATLIIIGACAVLTFTPVEFVHPVRVRQWRPLTLAIAGLWAALAMFVLLGDLNAPLPIMVALAGASVYLAAAGAVQQLTR
jgi:phosphatidylcholine synthase